MSKLQHTPGPWKHEQTDPVETELDIVIESESSTLGWVYSCRNGKANARLIAAAPEMLEALIAGARAARNHNVDVSAIDNIIERATGLSIEEVLSE